MPLPRTVVIDTNILEQYGFNLASEVWRAQKGVKPGERVPNPVLQERQRRRR